MLNPVKSVLEVRLTAYPCIFEQAELYQVIHLGQFSFGDDIFNVLVEHIDLVRSAYANANSR